MLTFKTSASAALLEKFEDAIAGKGDLKEVDTWVKVSSGPHAEKFTHTSERHKDKAYMTAKVREDGLSFYISWPDDKKPPAFCLPIRVLPWPPDRYLSVALPNAVHGGGCNYPPGSGLHKDCD